MKIRDIRKEDNAAVAEIIRFVLTEFSVPKEGTAFADLSLDAMYEEYNRSDSKYFVVENEGRILGGSGIFPLSGEESQICELQKMYFLEEIRGIGMGRRLIEHCLNQARLSGYKYCYLETLPKMTAAQELYKKTGFRYLHKPLGNTGHHACTVWMIKDL